MISVKVHGKFEKEMEFEGSLGELFRTLGLCFEAYVALVNGKLETRDYQLKDQDRVSFIPVFALPGWKSEV